MARNALRKTSLENMEAEIESLLKTLETLKHDASEESHKTIKAIRGNAENALKHSRSVLSDAYDEVKTRTRQTGIATRDYAQEHPWTAAGVAVGALGLLPAPGPGAVLHHLRGAGLLQGAAQPSAEE